jgi:choline dehydrogenase-like flavoprotein
VDLYAVLLPSQVGLVSGLKELAFNDYYLGEFGKLGTVQSFGALPPSPVLVAAMENDLGKGGFSWLVPAFRLIKPTLRWHLARRLSRALILASIVEDLPYRENRVTPKPPDRGAVICYQLRPNDVSRIKTFRQQMNKVLSPQRFMLIRQAENNERIAHACGTCRFGFDSHTSVLDPSNKAHEVSNLFVVDASFFPTSAGINPALTIAANALRVADRIVGNMLQP